MAGFGRMNKIGRGAGAGHSGRYFAGNMAGLSHATNGRLTCVHGRADVMMGQVYLTSSNGLERTLTRPPSARRLGFGRGRLSAL